MINSVTLVGRLTKDVELRQTQSGLATAKFTLAVNRPFKSQDGEQQADFIQVVVWRKQAENCAQYLRKGSLAGVTGRIQTGSYEGQDGKRVYTTDVVADNVQFLEPKQQQQGQQQTQQYNNPTPPPQQQSYNQQPSYGQGGAVKEDDLPF
ncbi:single-stranded DNA-binding protein [Kurthia senegalensis]|uniref:single-stranded DNA-binding protein n=1 Tax=Kurthia senegalensis TaxID=1033740 RepID=UPI000287BBEB|nr:single-stranded DNA-binding protein [Kurthia senegalensis]